MPSNYDRYASREYTVRAGIFYDPGAWQCREILMENLHRLSPNSRTATARLPTPEPEAPKPRLTAEESQELISRPLDTEEIYRLRLAFYSYTPSHEYQYECGVEKGRIYDLWEERNSQNRPLYRGPDLLGGTGARRLHIMARSTIRKRWQTLGIWNPEWRIEVPWIHNENWRQRCEWSPRPVQRRFDKQPHEVQVASWPSRDEEYPDERAVRKYLERKGQWTEAYALSHSESTAAEIDIDPIESFITSRPWYIWSLEVKEEAIKSSRVGHFPLLEAYMACGMVERRWKAKGDWKDTWGDFPRWKWKHESPSPEPEDPNEMDFSPSEIDALESIPTTPPPLSPGHSPEWKAPAKSLFGNLPPKGDDHHLPPWARPNKGPPSNNDKTANGKQASDEEWGRGQAQKWKAAAAPTSQQSGTSSPARRDQRDAPENTPGETAPLMPCEPLSPVRSLPQAAPPTGSLRKRKRDAGGNSPTHDSSSARQEIRAKYGPEELSGTTCSADKLPQQPAQNLARNVTIVGSRSQVHSTSKQPLSKPRRSRRIAQLPKAGEQSGPRTKAGTTRKGKDSAAPGATQPDQGSKSKRPKKMGKSRT